MLQAPPWFHIDEARRSQILYLWDDARGSLDLAGADAESDAILRTALRITPRARMALCIGLFEWVVWRFAGLHPRDEPQHVLEAAWCAAADPRYLRFFELPRDQWRGPVEGPLWAAIACLRPALSSGPDFTRDLYEGLSCMTRIALHVQPEPQVLRAWLAGVLERMEREFPQVPDDPFADLFSRNPGPRLGPLAGRKRLDPGRDGADDRQFLADTLRQARVAANPFLATPGELQEAGFRGTPYQVIE